VRLFSAFSNIYVIHTYSTKPIGGISFGVEDSGVWDIWRYHFDVCFWGVLGDFGEGEGTGKGGEGCI
jgi:hypothetical protein